MTPGSPRPAKEEDGEPAGPWRRARERALSTPGTRNRYVDLLRAGSIVVVVLGHWLMAAPTAESGVRFTLSDMLGVAPWTQWLTWLFQVMPIFFVVGGYANAASWEAARGSSLGYEAWVSRRLQRLVRPMVPFVLVWCGLAGAARWLGMGREIVRSGSQAAFVPTWFLAVYVLVVVIAPPMHWLWRRYGMASFWALVVGAAVVDAAARTPGVEALQWLNYIFVWSALHQIGYAWREGTLAEPSRALSFALAGLAGLVVLRGLASYPTSMVTVPGETAANSNPPTLALLALGVTHTGLALAMERPAQRLLQQTGLWTAIVFINGVIMTVYLWHATVMVLLVGVAELPGGVGLRFSPNTLSWWATRPAWILVLLGGLGGFVSLFGRVEAQRGRPTPTPRGWRSVLGAIAVCVGLVALAAGGVGADSALGVRPAPVLLTLAGVLLVAAGRMGRSVSLPELTDG